MLRRIIGRLADQWLAALALFLVLTGGSAYALAGHNTIRSDDIVNRQVKDSDLANGAVTANKLEDRAVDSATVADSSLTGSDIDESTLRGINASTLAGKSADAFVSKSDPLLAAPESLREVGEWSSATAVKFACPVLANDVCEAFWSNQNDSPEYSGPNENPLSFYKDRGVVHLRGVVLLRCTTASSCQFGATDPAARLIFTLPPGYRPAAREVQGAVTGLSGRVQPVFIDRNGEVSVAENISNGDPVSLDGVNFRATG